MRDYQKTYKLIKRYLELLSKEDIGLDREININTTYTYNESELSEAYSTILKTILDQYEQAVKDDKGQISDLIQRAKGPDRTMAEFSEAVGTSASTLSRAVNQKNTRPLSMDVLAGIAENAAEGSGVDWKSLLHANGYRKKRVRPVSTGNEIWDKTDRRTRITRTVQQLVLASGAQVSMLDRYSKPCPELDQYCLDYGFPSKMELIMKTNLFEDAEIWVVNPCQYAAKDDGADQVSLILGFLSTVLMIDRWRPDQLKHIRYTVAVEDEVMYDALVMALKNLHAITNTCFTVLLVDTEDEEFVEEYVLPSTGNSYKSIIAKKEDSE